jgi:hypothetical protein
MLPDCDNSRAWTVTLWPIGTTAQSAAAIPQVQAVKIIGTSADRKGRGFAFVSYWK